MKLSLLFNVSLGTIPSKLKKVV